LVVHWGYVGKKQGGRTRYQHYLCLAEQHHWRGCGHCCGGWR